MPLDWAIRYAPIVDFVRRCGPTSILEVGSGPQGLANYLCDRSIVGTDVKFGELPVSNMRAVAASAEALPFRDRSFELVVSSDMMEHLPASMRGSVVDEMLRVSQKHLIIGFPSGNVAKRHDLELRATLQRRKAKPLRWLEEHVQHEYPTSASILQTLQDKAIRYRVMPNANWRLHKASVLMQTNYRFNRCVRFFKLDSLKTATMAAAILNHVPTYREILFIERTENTTW
jgi:SAM-dependent methyltransferase